MIEEMNKVLNIYDAVAKTIQYLHKYGYLDDDWIYENKFEKIHRKKITKIIYNSLLKNDRRNKQFYR